MNNVNYIRCYTCGKHFPQSEALGEHFCSLDCATEYTQCSVCRRFFLKEEAWLKGNWCSEECYLVEQDDKTIEVTL